MANEKSIKTRVINKHDIEANWNLAVNFIPHKGEIIIYDADEQNQLPRIKIGDGKTIVTELDFIDGLLEEHIVEKFEDLVSCGTTDPSSSTNSKFYFKYS